MPRRTRSSLEYALLASGKYEHPFRQQLLNYLDQPTLRRLREVSPVVRDMVDSKSGRMFRDLYIRAPLDEEQPDRAFERVANFSHNLTITIRSRPSSSSSSSVERRYSTLSQLHVPQAGKRSRRVVSQPSWYPWQTPGEAQTARQLTARVSLPFGQLQAVEQSAQLLTRRMWDCIFDQCHKLEHLTLRVDGDSGWPGRTAVENELVIIRTAVERAKLANLREVHFTPVHATGIIHLRWAGLGAFASSAPVPSIGPGIVWQRLEVLDLQMLNPFTAAKLTPVQELMFKKLLYDYLRNFTPTLRVLRFTWLNTDGPSPLTLHLEDGLAGEREPLRWQMLEKLWVGNITFPNRTLANTDYLAPRLYRLWMLRSTYRNSRVDHRDASAWVDRMPPPQPHSKGVSHLRSPATADNASSIYSRSATSSLTDLGSISRTSRDVPFMLDMTGRQSQALEMRRRMEKAREGLGGVFRS